MMRELVNKYPDGYEAFRSATENTVACSKEAMQSTKGGGNEI